MDAHLLDPSASLHRRGQRGLSGVRGATTRAARGGRRGRDRRQRLAVHLAVGRQRQRLEHHEGRRHHVLGQPRRDRRATARPRASRSSTVRRRPRRRPAAHRPRRQSPSTRASTTASRTPGWAARAASISPSSMRKPAHLDLVVQAPQELHLAVRQAAAAPGRRVRYSRAPGLAAERIRHEALRRQLRPAQVAAAHLHAADVQLPGHPDRHRLAPAVEQVDARVRAPAGRSAPAAVRSPAAHGQ